MAEMCPSCGVLDLYRGMAPAPTVSALPDKPPCQDPYHLVDAEVLDASEGPEYIEFRGQTWRVVHDQWTDDRDGGGTWHLDIEGPYTELVVE